MEIVGYTLWELLIRIIQIGLALWIGYAWGKHSELNNHKTQENE